MIRKIWWGNQHDKKKFHTIKWSELCKRIPEGGLGIWDFRSNNLTLLAKTT